MTLFNQTGTVLGTIGPVVVNPGNSIYTSSSSLTASSPTYCSFRFSGKFRGSFTYVNGTEVTVIPATK